MQDKINDILCKMSAELSADQLTKLQQTLSISLYEKDNGEDSAKSNEQILNMYFSSLKIGGRSEKTIQKYALDIKNMLKFFDNKNLLTITANDIRYYLAWYQENRGVKNTTLENMRLSFTAFYGWLENEEYIQKNPVKKISAIKKDTQPEKIFTPDEIEKLKFGATNDRDRAIITFLASTCCRVSELCETDISDVDFIKREVRVHGKGNKDRIVYLDEIASYYLKIYLEKRTDDNLALFVTNKGQPVRIKRNSVEKLFSRLGAKLGMKNVHPHRFRASQITNLLRKGMSIQLVQNLAGHSNITTTEHYYRNDDTLVKNEFMRLC